MWQCHIVHAIRSCMGVSRIVMEGLVTVAITGAVMLVIMHWV